MKTGGIVSQVTVVPVTDLSSFAGLESEWNRLVTAHNNCLFLRHEFLKIWLETFAANEKLEILTGWSPEGRLVAALPLIGHAGSIRGVPALEIASTSNTHSCRFDMIAEDPVLAAEVFFHYLKASNDWDALRIADVPEDGQAWHLYEAAMAAGFPVGIWPSCKSPFLPLPRCEEELRGCVSSTLRSSARRKLRHMQLRAEVQIERIENGDLALVLEDFFLLERSSWKGRNGTACDQDEQTRAFYARLAAVAAEKDWLSFFRLTLDGQTAAFHYGLTYDGVYLLPKLAFGEKFGDLSPGLVLMHEVLRDCIHRQLSSIDLLGGDDEWKTRWSRAVRPHYWLYVFPKTLKGRMLHGLKFKWPALAKNAIRKSAVLIDA